QEPAVAAAGHAQLVSVNPRVLFERGIHTCHHVLVIHAAPVVHNAALELLAVSGGSARIAEEHCPAFARIDLELVIPVHAILAGGSAVDAHHHWILPAGLPAYGLYDETIDVPAVGALVRT